MKRCISFFAALMACCAIYSCSKNDEVKPGDDDNNVPEEEVPGDEVQEIQITIDGNFEDWDAITESSEDGTVYFCANGAEGYSYIRNLKATSDEDCIYMCVEIATNKILMAEGGFHGDSNDGMGFETKGPIWIYIDSDNNPETGIYPHYEV